MTGTVREILDVRGALVRALLAAERHLAVAKTRELRIVYETDIAQINRAIRIVEGSESTLTRQEREWIDSMASALQSRKEAS